MSKTDDAWEEVGSHFTALGRKFKDHYGTREGDDGGSDLKDAFRGLVDAAERVASTIGDTMRDEEVRSEAKAAATSFVDALGSTFGEIGEEFRKVFSTRDAPDDPEMDESQREVAEAAGDMMPEDAEQPEDE